MNEGCSCLKANSIGLHICIEQNPVDVCRKVLLRKKKVFPFNCKIGGKRRISKFFSHYRSLHHGYLCACLCASTYVCKTWLSLVTVDWRCVNGATWSCLTHWCWTQLFRFQKEQNMLYKGVCHEYILLKSLYNHAIHGRVKYFTGIISLKIR